MSSYISYTYENGLRFLHEEFILPCYNARMEKKHTQKNTSENTLSKKVIIVTGASHGIGLALAKELSSLGAYVVLAARSADKIEALSKDLRNSLDIVTDMTDPSSIKKMIDKTVKKYGRVDVLVNNAGQGMYGAIENVSPEEYKK